MSLKATTTLEKMDLSHYQIVRDQAEDSIAIPAGPQLKGYLVRDTRENVFAQARFLNVPRPVSEAQFDSVWKNVKRHNDAVIFPEMLASGREKSGLFYVSSLPNGEPITRFIAREGSVPPANAVPLISRFVRALCSQKMLPLNEFTIFPQSVWIAQDTKQPRIVLGDFSPGLSNTPETDNANLVFDLLKFIAGNPPFDTEFQCLCRAIKNGPTTLVHIEECLKQFEQDCPAPPYWNQATQPTPLLLQLVDPRDLPRSAELDLSHKEAKRVNRPLFLTGMGIAMAGLSLVILDSVLNRDALENPPAYASKQVSEPRSKVLASRKPIVVAEAEPKEKKVPSAKLPEKKKAPAPVIAKDDPPKKTVPKAEIPKPALPEKKKAPAPVIAKDDPPKKTVPKAEIPKPALPEKKKAPAPVIAKDDLPKKTVPKAEIPKPALPERKGVAREKTTSPPPKPPKPIAPKLSKKEKKIAENSRRAAEARNAGKLLAALSHELSSLRLDPNLDAEKKRLKSDLKTLKVTSGTRFSDSEISLLENAGKFDEGAFDLLKKYYRESGERVFRRENSTDSAKAEALANFVKAADLGDTASQFFAGECFVLGKGCKKDPSKGVAFLEKAVAGGSGLAMDLLGICYVRSWGVSQNDAKAVELFQSAIEAGNVASYYNLGARYAQGQGVERDPDKAAEIFEKGGNLGNAPCMFFLARCYENGYGREENSEKAIHWFRKSARQGFDQAVAWCKKNRVDF